ncbi:MAG: hypothetical protein Q7S02_02380 [bacterium]|nr:hypothetical protein [bacterium]
MDPTKAFPRHRNLKAEQFALKNFVNFFGHPPARNPGNTPASKEDADQHWWAVKYMAYHLRLLPTARDLEGERSCMKLFLSRDVDLYKEDATSSVTRKVRKPTGAPPVDRWDYDFIRACTYSGAMFTASTPDEPVRRLLF